MSRIWIAVAFVLVAILVLSPQLAMVKHTGVWACDPDQDWAQYRGWTLVDRKTKTNPDARHLSRDDLPNIYEIVSSDDTYPADRTVKNRLTIELDEDGVIRAAYCG